MTGEEFARAALLERRIVVCVGCGGVGKTTIAASLALEAARRGRRTLVLTIDPARRLADALGIAALGNAPQAIPSSELAGLGVPPGGTLSAMMLDMKRTFDDLVERFAESPEARDRILANPIYQHASDALSGSIEYSAMEKVYELHQSGAFDLIVVDTPPAQHALDFLDAPDRLLAFLDSKLVQVLIHPAFAAGRFGFKLFQRSTRRVLKLLERVSGLGFLEDISEFLLAFEGMAEGFRERAQLVRGLLLGKETSFVLVAGPGRDAVPHAARLLERLGEYGVTLSGVVLNRMQLWPDAAGSPAQLAGSPAPDDVAALARALAERGGNGLDAQAAAQAAIAAATGYASMVERDARAAEDLRAHTEGAMLDGRTAPAAQRSGATKHDRFWSHVPELDYDVHDLDGIARIARLVIAGSGETAGR